MKHVCVPFTSTSDCQKSMNKSHLFHVIPVSQPVDRCERCQSIQVERPMQMTPNTSYHYGCRCHYWPAAHIRNRFILRVCVCVYEFFLHVLLCRCQAPTTTIDNDILYLFFFFHFLERGAKMVAKKKRASII